MSNSTRSAEDRKKILSSFGSQVNPESSWTLSDYLNYISYNPGQETTRILSENKLLADLYGSEVQNMTQAELERRLNIFNTWYNSEDQSSRRLRGAGVNPDLVGLGDASDASVNSPSLLDIQADAAASQQAQSARISAITNGVSSVVGSVIQTVGAIFGLQSTGLQNQYISALAENDIKDSDLQRLQDYVPLYLDWRNAGSPEDKDPTFDIANRIVGDTSHQSRFKKRISFNRKASIIGALASYGRDPSRLGDFIRDTLSSSDASIRLSSFNDQRDDVTLALQDYVVESYRAMANSARADSKNYSNLYDFYQTINPELQGSAFNMGNSASVQRSITDFNTSYYQNHMQNYITRRVNRSRTRLGRFTWSLIGMYSNGAFNMINNPASAASFIK